MKPSYFETLNDALNSEGLIDLWPLNQSIAYGETVQVMLDNLLISIYRHNLTGRYERPIHYATA